MNTKDAKEIVNCENSFLYFCENYIHIIHPEHVLISLILYNSQQELVSCLETNSFVIGEKFDGITTVCLIYSLWKAIFTNTSFLHLGENSFDILETAVNFLPNLFKSKIKLTKNCLIVNENVIYVQTEFKPVVVNTIFVQEASYLNNLKSNLESLKGRNYYIFSTLDKKDNWFYRTYQEANKNGFKVFSP